MRGPMPELQFDDQNALYFEHHRPARDSAQTFVFINALTGSTEHWEAMVAPALRATGHGTLTYNFRGQARSRFVSDLELTQTIIETDLVRLIDAEDPADPILVGLSIGGLYAAGAVAWGVEARGLVLLNTLREINPRIAWINDALPHFVGTGGTALFMGAMMPLLVNPDFAEAQRSNFLKGPYAPLDPDHGHANLMRNSTATDWAFDWSSLELPVLSITGLHDRVFRDAEVIDRLFATIPHARREDWEDAGHLIPLERPERLVASLTNFASDLNS